MNEAETRAELIDPQLREAGRGILDGASILRERHITDGKIQTGGGRGSPSIADYILVDKNRQLAVIEAKRDVDLVNEGVRQAKDYAAKLHLDFTFAANGVEELDQEKLPQLPTLKYQALDDAKEVLGTIESIRDIFVGFQKFLYEQNVAA